MHMTSLLGQLVVRNEPNDLEISIHPVAWFQFQGCQILTHLRALVHNSGSPSAFEHDSAWIVIYKFITRAKERDEKGLIHIARYDEDSPAGPSTQKYEWPVDGSLGVLLRLKIWGNERYRNNEGIPMSCTLRESQTG
jgi:hypothetical protein